MQPAFFTLTAGRFVADKAKIDGYFPAVVRPKAERIGALIQQTAGRAYRNGREDTFRLRDPHKPRRRTA